MKFTRLLTTIDLPGSPSEFGERGGKPEDWRERLCSVASESFRDLDMPISRPVKLKCEFRVLKTAKQHDIDNLLKPLIDGLGGAGLFAHSGNARSKWNTDDSWVYAIDAEKRLVEQEEAGTHIEIYLLED